MRIQELEIYISQLEFQYKSAPDSEKPEIMKKLESLWTELDCLEEYTDEDNHGYK